VSILPALILFSIFCNIDFKEAFVPSSTITPPPALFHAFAISSRTSSARPSSRQAAPQFLPTKVARACKEEDVIVKLCLLVKVRNATGRRVEGGSKIGRIDCFVDLSEIPIPNAEGDDGTVTRTGALCVNSGAPPNPTGGSCVDIRAGEQELTVSMLVPRTKTIQRRLRYLDRPVEGN
jgi:hypothetical protein